MWVPALREQLCEAANQCVGNASTHCQENIKPWIEKRPLKDANKAIMDMTAGKARYRYTLVNEAHA